MSEQLTDTSGTKDAPAGQQEVKLASRQVI